MVDNTLLDRVKDNIIISDAFTKADQVINRMGYKNIMVSISGGKDSDIILDIVQRVAERERERYTTSGLTPA